MLTVTKIRFNPVSKRKMLRIRGRQLLALALEAPRARASLGEISLAVEKVCGRPEAVIRSISGVYSSEYEDDDVIRSTSNGG